jgi:hypothetical protein
LQSSVVGNRARRNRVAEADPEFNRSLLWRRLLVS